MTHPPMADKTICVDFDGTLYPFGYMFSFPPPIEGAVQKMQEFKQKGYEIIIFTSRLSKDWLISEGHEYWDHYYYIHDILKRDGIPHDRVTAEKIPARYYIDDKAIPFRGNWAEINLD